MCCIDSRGYAAARIENRSQHVINARTQQACVEMLELQRRLIKCGMEVDETAVWNMNMPEGLWNIIKGMYYMPSAFVNNTAINAHDFCSALSRWGCCKAAGTLSMDKTCRSALKPQECQIVSQTTVETVRRSLATVCPQGYGFSTVCKAEKWYRSW